MGSDGDGEPVTKSVRGGRLDYQIVEAIAEVTGLSPVDLPPLYESVDLDAMATIVADHDDGVSVTFEHCGVAVTVADGTITAEPE